MVYELVSVNEHGYKETQKQYIENEHKQCDENFALRELVCLKILSCVKSIKDVEDNLEEGCFVDLKFRSKLSADDDEKTNKKSKGDQELLEFTDHLIYHHDELSKLLCSLKQHNHSQRVLANND
jgi:hypothetical protein